MASFKEKVQGIIDELTVSLKDAEDLDKGKKVSATRLRVALQSAKGRSQEIRNEISEYRKTL